MKEYVILFCHRLVCGAEDVLLILKDRPAWQKGKLNLPGGGIEAGETPEQAAKRELMEETGLEAYSCRQLGTMKDREFVIHCLYGHLRDARANFTPRDGETETPLWLPWPSVMSDPRLIPNLRVIMPLMLCGSKGWVITDNKPAAYQADHTFSISVPTYQS